MISPPARILAVGGRVSFLRGVQAACDDPEGETIVPTSCPDATTALAAAAADRFDLVVVDATDPAATIALLRSLAPLAGEAATLAVLTHADAALSDALRLAGARAVLTEDDSHHRPLGPRLRAWVWRGQVARLRRQHRTLIEASPDARLVIAPSATATSSHGTIRFASRAAGVLFGRAPAQLAGETIALPPSGANLAEIGLDRSDGARRAEMRTVGIEWDGQPALLATLRDVTDQHEIDDRLRQSRKLEAIGQLAAGIAHDFNNILQGLIGNLEVVMDALPNPSTARECADFAVKAAWRGSELTDRLLSFARRQMLWPRRFALLPLLNEVRALVPRGAGTALLRLAVGVDPAVSEVIADPTQLQTALLNLVINAIDAMTGGGEVRIDAHLETSAGFPSLPPGRFTVIGVADTGPGMDAVTQARAFEPFFSTKGNAGTGLGLPMVQDFARRSGGDARIISAPGQGTRVELWLPDVNPDQADPAPSVA